MEALLLRLSSAEDGEESAGAAHVDRLCGDPPSRTTAPGPDAVVGVEQEVAPAMIVPRIRDSKKLSEAFWLHERNHRQRKIFEISSKDFQERDKIFASCDSAREHFRDVRDRIVDFQLQ